MTIANSSAFLLASCAYVAHGVAKGFHEDNIKVRGDDVKNVIFYLFSVIQLF